MEVSPERRATFLRELAAHGIVARAARAASPHSAHGCVQSFRDLRDDDREFAAAWDDAMDEARGAVESELHRRAVEGVDELIYGGRYREKVVGTVKKYSDRLLELRVKALLPEYRDRSQVELGGGLDMKHAVVPRQRFAALNDLAPETRQELRALLERELARTECRNLTGTLLAPLPPDADPIPALASHVEAAASLAVAPSSPPPDVLLGCLSSSPSSTIAGGGDLSLQEDQDDEASPEE